MDNLEPIADFIRQNFEATHAVREVTLKRSRELIPICSKAIRAMHRKEWEKSLSLLEDAKNASEQLIEGVTDHPNLYFTGYTQDALKEYVEATLTYALIKNQPLSTPEELGVECNTWLNGLAEATTELRRYILDLIRLLDKMDEVYSILITFDFADSITGGLRRRTDTVRAVLERTRGDITQSLRQEKLQKALHQFEQQFENLNQ